MAQTKEAQGTSPIQPRNSEFSLSKNQGYNINNLSYPTGVSTEPDLLHYVSFFFNVRGKSTIFKNNLPSQNTAIGTAGENRLDTKSLGVPIIAGGAVMGATLSLNLGRTFGNRLLRNLTARGTSAATANIAANVVNRGTNLAAGAAGGAAVALVVKPNTTYRIGDVVTLHLPHAPKVSYNVSYAEVELGSIIGITAGSSSAVSTTTGAIAEDAAKALLLSMAASGANNAAAALAKSTNTEQAVTSAQVMAATQLSEGQSLNPFREVLFKGVAMKRHSFNYVFMPKSETESQNIHNILKVFRYHAMPELNTSGIYLIHPSEVVAQIYFNGEENLNFPKMATSVIESVDITYGGDKFSSFRDGSPTEIHMSLILREISTMTKSSIQEGY